MDVSKLSLAQLRAELRAVSDEAELHRLSQALGSDARAGARALADRICRRLAALRADRERQAELFALRARLRGQGARLVAGVDGVGLGPRAGPVDAAIREQALGIGVGEVAPAEIDRLNIYWASLEAMRRAVKGLPAEPDHLLVDARHITGISVAQTPLVHGDARDGSIAAASIVAKVYRDALMRELSTRYPGYGLDRHMGYGTAQHVAALRRLGATPIHRRSFRPVAAVLSS